MNVEPEVIELEGKPYRVVSKVFVESPIVETDSEVRKRQRAGKPRPMVRYVAVRVEAVKESLDPLKTAKAILARNGKG